MAKIDDLQQATLVVQRNSTGDIILVCSPNNFLVGTQTRNANLIVSGNFYMSGRWTFLSKSQAFDDVSPLIYNGDLISFSSTAGHAIRIGTGSQGQILSVDSATSGGVKWINNTGGGGSSSGSFPAPLGYAGWG